MGKKEAVFTIRGVDRSVYDALSLVARQSGKTLGDIFTEAGELYLRSESSQPGTRVIGNMERLTLSRAELERLGPLMIRSVKHLRFSEDVDEQAFETSVSGLENCEEIEIPELAYPAALSKARYCGVLIKVAKERVFTIRNEGEANLCRADITAISEKRGKFRIANFGSLRLSADVDEKTLTMISEIDNHGHLIVDSQIIAPLWDRLRNEGRLEVVERR